MQIYLLNFSPSLCMFSKEYSRSGNIQRWCHKFRKNSILVENTKNLFPEIVTVKMSPLTDESFHALLRCRCCCHRKAL